MSTAERFHHYRPRNPAACFAAASVPNMAAMTTTETMLQLPRIAARDICIRAADGYRLAGTLFEPKQASGGVSYHCRAGSRYFQRVLPQVRLLPRGKGEAVTGLRLPWNGRVSPWPTRRISGAAA